jgi:hypothetical protein
VNLSSNVASSIYGQYALFEFIMYYDNTCPAPSGQVDFWEGDTYLFTGAWVDYGYYIYDYINWPWLTVAGSPHYITAYYYDYYYQAYTYASQTVPVTIYQASTSTSLTASPNPSVFGQNVTLSAVVNFTSYAGTPTNWVYFYDNGSYIGYAYVDGFGNASLALTSLGIGSHTFSAYYVGDGNFLYNLSGNYPQTVNQAGTKTTITGVNPVSPVVGQLATVTYQVAVTAPGSGTPTGNVTVNDGHGATCIGTVAAGSCQLKPTVAASDNLTATYSGDTDFGASTSGAFVVTTQLNHVYVPLALANYSSGSNPVQDGEFDTWPGPWKVSSSGGFPAPTSSSVGQHGDTTSVLLGSPSYDNHCGTVPVGNVQVYQQNIKLPGGSPTLTFDYNLWAQGNVNQIYSGFAVYVNSIDSAHKVWSNPTDVGNGCQASQNFGWLSPTSPISLSGYEGQTITLYFVLSVNSNVYNTYVYLDNVAIN